ncbi:MAG: HAD family hydrolase [Candidatus Bathyarchaeota archaeon]|nr:HAD family hydrolase [Candidatus Bathyarchaeota archaeon]
MRKGKLAVKGLLCDLDGTLMNTKEAYVEAAKLAFLDLGQDPPVEAVALEIPRRIEQRLPLTELVSCDDMEFLRAYLKAFYSVSKEKVKPFPDVKSTLEALSQKAKLAIITMRYSPKEVVASELKQFGLDKYFSCIVTACDTPEPKPSPEALFKAAEAIDLKTSDCAIVGDSIIDVQAGKAAGIKTVAVLSGLYSHTELSKSQPNYILETLTQLSDLLE